MARPHKRTDRAIAEPEESGGTSAALVAAARGKGGAAKYWLRVEPIRKARGGKWRPEGGLREKYVLHAASGGETDVTLHWQAGNRDGVEADRRGQGPDGARAARRSRLLHIRRNAVQYPGPSQRGAPGRGSAPPRGALAVAMILHRTAGELVSELRPPSRAPPDPAAA